MFLQDSNHLSRNWLALPPQWYRRTDRVVCASGVLLHPRRCSSCKGSAWLKVYPLLASLGGVCDGEVPFSDKLGSEFRCRCGENRMWVLDGGCFKMNFFSLQSRPVTGQRKQLAGAGGQGWAEQQERMQSTTCAGEAFL